MRASRSAACASSSAATCAHGGPVSSPDGDHLADLGQRQTGRLRRLDEREPVEDGRVVVAVARRGALGCGQQAGLLVEAQGLGRRPGPLGELSDPHPLDSTDLTFPCTGTSTVRRMSQDTWDLVVIGTGGAAMAAGIEARSRGRTVLLVEHGPLGGTCLNVGCVPSKHLLAAAGQRHRAKTSTAFPMVKTHAGGVDLPALMAQKEDLIDSLRQAKYAEVADVHGFPIRYGHARFTDDRTLEVDGEPVVGAAYVVATGAAPHVPDLPGLDGIDWLSSTTAMEQQFLPRSMVVLGGGPVGLEQAQLWSHLGTQVTLVGRLRAVRRARDRRRAARGLRRRRHPRRRGACARDRAHGGRRASAHGRRRRADRRTAAGRDGSVGGDGRPGAGRRWDRDRCPRVRGRRRLPAHQQPAGVRRRRRVRGTAVRVRRRADRASRSRRRARRAGHRSTTAACPASPSPRRSWPAPG